MSLGWFKKHAEKLFDTSSKGFGVLCGSNTLSLQEEIIGNLERQFNLEVRIVEIQEKLIAKQDEVIKTQNEMLERSRKILSNYLRDQERW